jgi:DNA-binding phage protein
MYRIKNKIRQIRNVLRWIPIIWRDRDWDYYFVYEILKQKLIDTEKYIRKDGLHVFNEHDADSIKTAIEMIEKVQTEYHLDKYLSEATEWTKEGMDKAAKDHDKARRELFKHLSNNIEKWWD